MRSHKRYFGLCLLLILLLAMVIAPDFAQAHPLHQTRSQDVTFTSGDITLAGTLDLPAAPGSYPAVVMVHGSGRSTRDDYAGLVQDFTERGIAVLRYDKRGVGESGGIYSNVGTQNAETMLGLLADDAAAGAAFLTTQPEINPERIGLFGFSQAGWIIPLAASRSQDIAFMVMVVGPVVTVGQEIYYSDLTGDESGGGVAASLELTDEEVLEMVQDYKGTVGFDPVPVLVEVNVPGLWVLGEADLSIPTPLTVSNLEMLIETYEKDFTIQLYPNAGHSMRDADTGRFVNFMEPAIDWILAQWEEDEAST